VNIQAWSAEDIRTKHLPGPSALIRLADSGPQLIQPRNQANVIDTLDIIANDCTTPHGRLVQPPTPEQASRIVSFWQYHVIAGTKHLIVQCQAGIGRSRAVVAALDQEQRSAMLRYGTHNRRLYRLLMLELHAKGLTWLKVNDEPLVSMVVRVKYDWERMTAFYYSMARQRYENWELIFVSDGSNFVARDQADKLNRQSICQFTDCDSGRVRYIETSEAKGYWGHPGRQTGIDAARGELIGLSNDDNYYVPGYLEQMVYALQEAQADLAMCQTLHSYTGWAGASPAGTDLGCWIAKRELVRACPWPGTGFTADQEHIQAMLRKSAKTVLVNRPLFVHN